MGRSLHRMNFSITSVLHCPCAVLLSLTSSTLGNTVILGLSTAGFPTGEPYAWLATLVSILSFVTGATVSFILARRAGALRRTTITTLFFLQGCLIFVSAGLASGHIVPKNTWESNDPTESNPILVAAIPPLAFNFGSQITTSRLLGYSELPTTVLTSTYADLAGDANFFTLRNVKRNRRLGAVVLQLLGAITGAWLERSSAGMVGVYWIAGSVKVLVAIAVFVFLKSAAAAEENSEADSPLPQGAAPPGITG